MLSALLPLSKTGLFLLLTAQVGLLDLELNRLTKALFLAQVVLSVVMVALQGFVGPWFRNLFRFVVLFSYIIPIRYFVVLRDSLQKCIS